jgi:3-phytase
MTKRRIALAGLISALLIATGLTSVRPLRGQQVLAVAAKVETAPSPGGDANGVSIWVHPTDTSLSLLISADEDSGITTFDLNGQEVQRIKARGIANLDLRYNFPLGGQRVTLVAAGNNTSSRLHFYTVDPETRQLTEVTAGEPKATMKGATGVCLYRSAVSGQFYLFAVSEDGDAEQLKLSDDGNGKVAGAPVRRFNTGGETEGCVADDELGWLYLSEEEVALWRYGAEPEAGNLRRVVDYGGGGGGIAEQVEGLAILDLGDGAGYLIAANEKAHNFLVYERGGENRLLATFTVAGGTIDEIDEPNGIDVVGIGMGEGFPGGLFVTSDDKNTNPSAKSNYKLASWADISAGLALQAGGLDPRQVGTAAIPPAALVTAHGQTDSVPGGRDAADDPAIWIHPTDPALSTVIGTDKQGGVAVYDLGGSQLQYLDLGQINNIDLRYNFLLGAERVAIVAASNRTTNTIDLFRVDPQTRLLIEVAAAPLVVEMVEIYGMCMYHSTRTGKFYAIANGTKTGDVEQWELADAGNGKVSGTRVRRFTVGTQTEGCVADDVLGHLYIGEEAVGVWKYGAEPESGEARTQVDAVFPQGKLTADVEGVTLYYSDDMTGYLVVSSQGASEFLVYQREGANTYLGRFRIVAGEQTDAVSGTDGLDVTNAALGTAFPDGLLVVQDDRRVNPDGNQNYKLVRWGDVARAFNPPLTISTTWDARAPR